MSSKYWSKSWQSAEKLSYNNAAEWHRDVTGWNLKTKKLPDRICFYRSKKNSFFSQLEFRCEGDKQPDGARAALKITSEGRPAAPLHWFCLGSRTNLSVCSEIWICWLIAARSFVINEFPQSSSCRRFVSYSTQTWALRLCRNRGQLSTGFLLNDWWLGVNRIWIAQHWYVSLADASCC